MLKRLSKILIGSAIAILGSAATLAAPANAGTLHTKAGFDLEWNYSIDSIRDGYDRRTLNYKGMALTETNDQYIFALSSDLDYDEEHSIYNSTHGDLFLNFSGEKFHTANGGDKLFAVKFAPQSDTDLAFGLYKDVVAGRLSGSRWASLANYYFGANLDLNSFGSDLYHPDDVYDYFNSVNMNTATVHNTPLFNGILSGTKIGDVSMVDEAALTNLGLDFEHFGAADKAIFGIAIDKSLFAGLLPNGLADLVAHVSLEYGDGVAIKGGITIPVEDVPTEGETVPEPATLLGLSIISLAFFKCKRHHNGDRVSEVKQ